MLRRPPGQRESRRRPARHYDNRWQAMAHRATAVDSVEPVHELPPSAFPDLEQPYHEQAEALTDDQRRQGAARAERLRAQRASMGETAGPSGRLPQRRRPLPGHLGKNLDLDA